MKTVPGNVYALRIQFRTKVTRKLHSTSISYGDKLRREKVASKKKLEVLYTKGYADNPFRDLLKAITF